MKNKPNRMYEVSSVSGRKLHVYAASSNQAKRIFCREYGLQPSDHWCGIGALTARILKTEEERAWVADAPIRNATYQFIKGMLDIHTNAYAEKTADA